MANTVGGSVIWNLDVDDSKFAGKLNKASDDAKKLGNDFDQAAKGSAIFAAGIAAVGAAAVAFGISSVKAFNESEKGLAQLNAVLASTKGAAGVTKNEVIKLAASLQRETSISDEATVAAQSMLLTFTNIGKKIFPDVTRAVVDMATAMNGGAIPSAEELRQQSIQLGKALQDPDKGLGALKRVGVNVDELSKKFNDSMSIQEKQILILKELNTEFGGSAKAAGQTFAGQVQLAKETFNDFQELVGKAIVDRMQPLIQAFNNWAKSIGGPDGAMKGLNVILENTARLLPIISGGIIGGLIPTLVKLGGVLWTNVILPLWALSPWIAVGAAIGVVVAALVTHFGGWGVVVQKLGEAFVFVQGKLKPFIDFAIVKFTRLGQILKGLGISGEFGTFINIFEAAGPRISTAIQRIGQIIGGFVQDIKNKLAGFGVGQKASWIDVFEGAANRLKPITDAIKATLAPLSAQLALTGEIIRTQIAPAFAALVETLKPLQKALSPYIKVFFQSLGVILLILVGIIGAFIVAALGIATSLVAGLGNALPYITQAFEGLIQFIRGVIQIVTGILTGDWGLAFEGFKQTVKGAYDFITNMFNSITAFISGFVKGIITFFYNLYVALIGGSIIPDIVNGVLMWINNMVNGFINLIAGLVTSVIQQFTDLWVSITNQISTWITDISAWGANLIKAFADGIKGAGQFVYNAITDVLNKAKSLLKGKSPPIEGPFKEIDKWGFNVGNAWTEGVQKAVRNLNLPGISSQISLSDPNPTRSTMLNMTKAAPAYAGGSVNVNVHEMNVTNEADIKRVGREIGFRTSLNPSIFEG